MKTAFSGNVQETPFLSSSLRLVIIFAIVLTLGGLMTKCGGDDNDPWEIRGGNGEAGAGRH